jgi:outer membrane receptor protein involved in Fe transport
MRLQKKIQGEIKMATAKRFVLSVIFAAIAATVGISTASAQRTGDQRALEEIVVTAQRREQALQEVPVSIEAVSGAEIQLQGYRDLNELANFSPSVYIDDAGFLSQDRSIRGFGTSGNALTLEQAVPIFVDGIHFGRPAQVKLAFMDPARVEILKGPQPVFFGMNATAGAFNIVSNGPTEEWEGYLDAEFGNYDTGVVRAAFGGPLSDTFGIRVATKYESAGGYIDDLVTGEDHGDYENIGARTILKFTPRDDLEVTFKAEYSEIDKDNEATSLCRTAGTLVYGRNDPLRDPGEGSGNERAVWADPDIDPVTGLNMGGVGWDVPHTPVTFDCFEDTGISNSGPFFEPPLNIHEENSDSGAPDVREAVDQWVKLFGISDGIGDMREEIESTNGYLELAYSFSNGIDFNWLNGWSTMNRANSRDNSNSPFLMNMQNRGEDFDQYSSELRFTSGPGTIEWMAGFLWQKTDLDVKSNSPRGNVRRGLRGNRAFEEQEWKTVFATVTFNFMDNRASIDLGGRYTDLDKEGGIVGFGAQWVFDVRPCESRGTDELNPPNPDPATCELHSDAIEITPADMEFVLPGANFHTCALGPDCLWVIPYRAERRTPLSWLGGRAAAVGMTALTPQHLLPGESGRGPYYPGRGGNFDTTEFDPQVTIRFRPNENHSLFLRYAESFKAGGFDTGVTTVNVECSQSLIDAGFCATPFDSFRFEGEQASSIELGSKGTLWDGRARYDVTLFETTFEDLQVATDTNDPDDPFANINAGEQRVRGIEFSITAAVSDSLSLGFAGALMDGELTDFPNSPCTTVEASQAINNPDAPCILRDDDGTRIIPTNTDEAFDADIAIIDRTGTPAPKTPDWKFVLGLNYETPIAGKYRLTFDAKGYVSDGFITDVSGFSEVVKMNEHEDLNLTLGIGPQDGNWQVAVYGRNLLEPRVEYNPEFDVLPDGIASAQLSRSDFATYGVKFRYNYE